MPSFTFSPFLLGALWRGPGPASPKANPNYRQPTVRLHSLSASSPGAPCRERGPLYICNARLLHFPRASFLESPGSLCCFWRPRCLPFPSLLLCLGPSGGDRGPQAQKPTQTTDNQPSGSILSLLPLPGAPCRERGPLYICNARLLHFPRASFLESPGSLCCFWRPRCLPLPFSPSLLGALWRGPGPASPKANPNYRQPTVRLHSLSASSSRAPLAGNGAPYIYATPVCCTSPGLPSLNLLALSAASGVPVAFLFPSLLLCLGPSGGDRGPQAQKPTQTTDNQPSGSILSLLPLPGAPCRERGPLYICNARLLHFPRASFLESPGSLCCFWRPRCLPFSFSPSLLGALWRGPGPASPKANPNYRQPTVRLHSLSASSSRAPLAGNGAPYIYATPVCCTSPGLPSLNPLALSAASGVPVAFLSLLSFSAWGPLAGTGARKPKKPTQTTDNQPSGSILSLLPLPGAPCRERGPLYICNARLLHFPRASFLESPGSLCCFWRPRCLPLPSLLLCLGPSGGDRGPQAQKPTQTTDNQPSGSILSLLPLPGAPCRERGPLYICNARLLHFPRASFLESPGSLCCFWRPRCLPLPSLLLCLGPSGGDRGPQAQKANPNYRQPTVRLQFLSASSPGRPLPGTGPLIYMQRPSVALPPGFLP